MSWKEVPHGEFVAFLASYGAPLDRREYREGWTTLVDGGLDAEVARSDGARFYLWTDDPPADQDAREAMIRSDAFGDVSGMGRRG